ncbi:cell division GTPase [Paenibacillus alvei]|uniref:tubulin-like doman-containing protein n=1 Tax=Paenibacillus alvei TaxID=44250 RepID=UPI0002889282|nr:tubulin-like doman-containing protein [Paenibacillus alvei]EJW13845.1 cell division GTPase [Paenibacillus alvei DSM 29]MCY9545096.1 cell division GTPase [Paenibacillus alvei]MCY9708342.1 cell division GTPase [Paenibacillus alvei]MCY9732970.1 cell division GTPase [Paenibacillus alvei]MCY9755264.1 cell division GTPase [Paenibacillus alvei]
MAFDRIDGVWPLEGFLEQKNAAPGIKYGWIGIGQGGSKIVDAVAGIVDKAGNQVYPVMIINSNLGDMGKLKNISKKDMHPLVGYEQGVGKNPEVGKEAFMQNGAEIFDAVAEKMAGCSFIYVVGSLGGGTGTGAINVLADAISDYIGIPVGAIVSLPRPNEIESLNAYNAMAELTPKLSLIREDEEGRQYRALENLVVLDNDKIIKEHTTKPEVPNLTWDFYSNYKVASIMHEWNVITSLESDYTLDAADLLNHIILGGGILTYAKKKINLDEVTNRENLIDEIISCYKEKNVLANGFDYQNDMSSMALVVVIPRDKKGMLNQDTLEIIRTRIGKELPHINFYPGFATWGSRQHALVYTMAKMAGLPERAKKLRTEVEELRSRREESEKKASGFGMGEKISTGNTVTARRTVGGNPFLKDASSNQAKMNNTPQTNQTTQTIRNPFPKKI